MSPKSRSCSCHSVLLAPQGPRYYSSEDAITEVVEGMTQLSETSLSALEDGKSKGWEI